MFTDSFISCFLQYQPLQSQEVNLWHALLHWRAWGGTWRAVSVEVVVRRQHLQTFLGDLHQIPNQFSLQGIHPPFFHLNTFVEIRYALIQGYLGWDLTTILLLVRLNGPSEDTNVV